MIDFYNRYAKNYKYSQNGEEGIIDEILDRIGEGNSLCMEFGANDGSWCSNTGRLLDNGWSGVMIESDKRLFDLCKQRRESPLVSCYHSAVGPPNINQFINGREFDLISMDTDGGNDYRVFSSMISKPRIVIIEINSGFRPFEFHISEDQGCSYKPMVELGIEKRYFLLCHTGNLVFVRNDFRALFPEIEGDGLTNSDLYFKKDWL